MPTISFEAFRTSMQSMGITDADVIRAMARKAGIDLPKDTSKDKVRYERSPKTGDYTTNAQGQKIILVPNWTTNKDGEKVLVRPYAFPADSGALAFMRADLEKKLDALKQAEDFFHGEEGESRADTPARRRRGA